MPDMIIPQNGQDINLDRLVAGARKVTDLGYETLPIMTEEFDFGGRIGIRKAKYPAPPYGPKHTTNDPEQIRRDLKKLFREHTGLTPAHFGLAISTQDLVVVDDDTGGERTEELVDQKRLSDDEPLMSTGSPRGGHEYYRGRDGADLRNKLLGFEGLDIKSGAAYVICSPTIISGVAYEWVTGPVPKSELPELPDAFYEIATKPQWDVVKSNGGEATEADRHFAIERVREEMKRRGIIKIGERNDTLYLIAAMLGDHGLDPFETMQVIQDEVMPFVEQQAGDTFPADELERVIQSAYNTRQNPVGSDTVAAKFSKIPDAVAAVPPVRAVAERDRRTKEIDDLEPRTMRQAMQEDVAKPAIVSGMISKGGLISLMAPSGHFKTATALSLCYHITQGKNFGPLAVGQPGVVWMIDQEGGLSTTERVKSLCQYYEEQIGEAEFPVSNWLLSNKSRFSFSDPEHIERAIDIVKRKDVDLIVVDTLSRAIRGVEENSAKEMSAIVDSMDRIREETGVAILLIAHTPKGNTKTVRGSGVIDAAMTTRVSIELKSELDETAEVLLYVDHLKDGISGRGVLLRNAAPGGLVLAPDPGVPQALALHHVMKMTCELIQENGGKPVQKSIVVELIEEQFECKDRKARAELKKMHNVESNNGTFELGHHTISWTPHHDAGDLLS